MQVTWYPVMEAGLEPSGEPWTLLPVCYRVSDREGSTWLRDSRRPLREVTRQWSLKDGAGMWQAVSRSFLPAQHPCACCMLTLRRGKHEGKVCERMNKWAERPLPGEVDRCRSLHSPGHLAETLCRKG